MVREFGDGDFQTRYGDDDCAHPLARALVRDSDDSDIRYSRVCDQYLLDLQRGNVLRIADDGVLDPAGHTHVPMNVDEALITSTEPAIRVESVSVERGIDIAEEALW